jgi:hypothetical protein
LERLTWPLRAAQNAGESVEGAFNCGCYGRHQCKPLEAMKMRNRHSARPSARAAKAAQWVGILMLFQSFAIVALISLR